MKVIIVGLLIALSNAVYADSFLYELGTDLHKHLYPFSDVFHELDGKETLKGVMGYSCQYHYSAYNSNDPEKNPIAIIAECRLDENDYRQLLCANLKTRKTDKSTKYLGINQHATNEELSAFFETSKCK